MYYKESFMIYSIQKVFSDYKIVTPKSLGLFWEAMIIIHLKSHKKKYINEFGKKHNQRKKRKVEKQLTSLKRKMEQLFWIWFILPDEE